MEPLTFWLQSFIGRFFRSHGSKNGPIQKSCYNKKSVFSCSSTTQRNFWNSFIMRPYFHNCSPWASTSMHIVTGTLTSKLFDLISLFWQDLPKNTLAGWIRDNRSHPTTYTCTQRYSLRTVVWFQNMTLFTYQHRLLYF